jgi:PTS system mannose-specific IIB component
MGLAVPSSVEVWIEPLGEVQYPTLLQDASRTLLLIRDVAGVLAAREKGLRLTHLNLGNIHYGPGRKKVSASVFLSQDELNQLKMLVDQGVEVEARGVPTDGLVDFAQMKERFGKGA